MPPIDYLRGPYYARWLYSIEKLLIKYELVKEEELKNPDGRIEKASNTNPADAKAILEALKGGDSARRQDGKAARFRVGDRVVVKNEHPEWHTRSPRYVRGRQGMIHLDHGVFVFPDSNSKGEGEQPQHCYNVVFSSTELWGSLANPKDRIYVDLFDDYLEPIPEGRRR
jgi:nitrile hydratase